MSLINCPECGKEISNHAEICIHCGYPIKKQIQEENVKNNICIINGTPRDLTEYIQNINNPKFIPLAKLVREYGMQPRDALILWDTIKRTKKFHQNSMMKIKKNLLEYLMQLL